MALDRGTRRTLMASFGAAALLALVVAVVVTALAIDSAPAWLVGSLVVVVLCLVAEVVLLVLGRERAPVDEPLEMTPVEDAPEAKADLLLRCSSCTRTFTTLDDGHRPLATLCPHCGQRGVIEAAPA